MAEAWQNRDAVSYTHLDVYKRQGIRVYAFLYAYLILSMISLAAS